MKTTLRSDERGSTFNRTERTLVKASVRKQVQELLSKAPETKAIRRLRAEFERKGFLSKRELRQLLDLKIDTQAA